MNEKTSGWSWRLQITQNIDIQLKKIHPHNTLHLKHPRSWLLPPHELWAIPIQCLRVQRKTNKDCKDSKRNNHIGSLPLLEHYGRIWKSGFKFPVPAVTLRIIHQYPIRYLVCKSQYTLDCFTTSARSVNSLSLQYSLNLKRFQSWNSYFFIKDNRSVSFNV